ncbi:GDP-mannose 4,6-dehydratase [Paenibacillus planticolens]|uniref:NAD-dependent epimerase/dehydratase family protein n=1 Tax=Paenibacillus planticolens TaxID=2654976 RepID=A0ABX1ZYX6_9BACL|nr:GDP-mannose 4,6-dehydratase [Paenibacillus planticolens]NOV04265.1 NAD-dependent epimerase/dehydratase family protein [Paenibacillus planticolens]
MRAWREPPLVLLTGINGFVGQHMAACLFTHNMNVIGVGRRSDCLLQHHRLHYVCGDITQAATITKLLQEHPITHIIHLAGANDVSASYADPVQTLYTNAWCTLHMLEAVRSTSARSIQGFLSVGTAYEYDFHSVPFAPLTETSPVGPVSPYAWSKQFMTSLIQMYGDVYAIPAFAARTFNLIGPGNATGVCALLARQVAMMEKGHLPPKLVVGNTAVKRDFLDVRDAAAAYCSLMQLTAAPPGSLFNVCSGTAYPISDIVDLLQQYAAIPFEVATHERLFRPNDPPLIQGDNAKLRSATGWQPTLSLAQSVCDTLNYYRSLL